MSIVPGSVFRLLTWHQLEEKVCGAQGIDLAILKINTEYDDGIRPEDEHIVFFWCAVSLTYSQHFVLQESLAIL